MHSSLRRDVCYIPNMCRMLLASIPDSDTDRALVLRSFLRLAESGKVPPSATPGHHDGWGYAAFSRGALLRHFRSEESGARDPSREREGMLLAAHKPDVVLAHVRKETVGEPSERNSHPFVSGRYAFIHNGTLGSTDQLIFDQVRGRAFGETDSEYYFHLIIGELDAEEERDSDRVRAKIASTVAALRVGTSHQGGGFTSASSILTDGRYAYVLREFDEEHPYVRRSDAIGYYTLFLGHGPRDERIVASERLELPEVTWEELPNHSVTVIDIASGTYETYPV